MLIFLVFTIVLLLLGGIAYYFREIFLLEREIRELEKRVHMFPGLEGRSSSRAAPKGREKRQIIL